MASLLVKYTATLPRAGLCRIPFSGLWSFSENYPWIFEASGGLSHFPQTCGHYLLTSLAITAPMSLIRAEDRRRHNHSIPISKVSKVNLQAGECWAAACEEGRACHSPVPAGGAENLPATMVFSHWGAPFLVLYQSSTSFSVQPTQCLHLLQKIQNTDLNVDYHSNGRSFEAFRSGAPQGFHSFLNPAQFGHM